MGEPTARPGQRDNTSVRDLREIGFPMLGFPTFSLNVSHPSVFLNNRPTIMPSMGLIVSQDRIDAGFEPLGTTMGQIELAGIDF